MILTRAAVLPLLGLLSVVSVFAQDADHAWLQGLDGVWEGQVRGNRYVEQWRCADGACEGMATSYKGDCVSMTERTRIFQFDGRWVYLVSANGDPVVCFTREPGAGAEWVFANAEHDFPQRIGYAVEGDSLKAWIEGPGEIGPIRLPFDLVRSRK